MTVQDVSVTDAHGMTLVSTDPDAVNQQAGVPVRPGEFAGWRRGPPDEGGVRQAASAGYLAGAGSEWDSRFWWRMLGCGRRF